MRSRIAAAASRSAPAEVLHWFADERLRATLGSRARRDSVLNELHDRANLDFCLIDIPQPELLASQIGISAELTYLARETDAEASSREAKLTRYLTHDVDHAGYVDILQECLAEENSLVRNRLVRLCVALLGPSRDLLEQLDGAWIRLATLESSSDTISKDDIKWLETQQPPVAPEVFQSRIDRLKCLIELRDESTPDFRKLEKLDGHLKEQLLTDFLNGRIRDVNARSSFEGLRVALIDTSLNDRVEIGACIQKWESGGDCTPVAPIVDLLHLATSIEQKVLLLDAVLQTSDIGLLKQALEIAQTVQDDYFMDKYTGLLGVRLAELGDQSAAQTALDAVFEPLALAEVIARANCRAPKSIRPAHVARLEEQISSIVDPHERATCIFVISLVEAHKSVALREQAKETLRSAYDTFPELQMVNIDSDGSASVNTALGRIASDASMLIHARRLESARALTSFKLMQLMLCPSHTEVIEWISGFASEDGDTFWSAYSRHLMASHNGRKERIAAIEAAIETARQCTNPIHALIMIQLARSEEANLTERFRTEDDVQKVASLTEQLQIMRVLRDNWYDTVASHYFSSFLGSLPENLLRTAYLELASTWKGLCRRRFLNDGNCLFALAESHGGKPAVASLVSCWRTAQERYP